MDTKTFTKNYWKYYINLEKEFLATEKYAEIDEVNYKTFSIEYLKIFQVICSEIDVLFKTLCLIIDPHFKGDNLPSYYSTITNKFSDFVNNCITVKKFENTVIPWQEWIYSGKKDKKGKVRLSGRSPIWWKDYNKVKHNRTLTINGVLNYKKANQKNVLLSLAALYQIEMYFYNYLSDCEGELGEAPLPKSKIFDIPKWTKTVAGDEDFAFTVTEVEV